MCREDLESRTLYLGRDFASLPGEGRGMCAGGLEGRVEEGIKAGGERREGEAKGWNQAGQDAFPDEAGLGVSPFFAPASSAPRRLLPCVIRRHPITPCRRHLPWALALDSAGGRAGRR